MIIFKKYLIMDQIVFLKIEGIKVIESRFIIIFKVKDNLDKIPS